jgi:hypothetical protein
VSLLKAELLYQYKYIFPEGDIVFIRFWKVQRSKDFPEGIKYSLAYVKKKNDEYERIFGYDNEKGKAHHEHMFGKEKVIEFTGMVKNDKKIPIRSRETEERALWR